MLGNDGIYVRRLSRIFGQHALKFGQFDPLTFDSTPNSPFIIPANPLMPVSNAHLHKHFRYEIHFVLETHATDEIAVVGVDNDNLVCELSSPPLSSIALSVERAGYEAADLLDKLMAGK